MDWENDKEQQDRAVGATDKINLLSMTKVSYLLI